MRAWPLLAPHLGHLVTPQHSQEAIRLLPWTAAGAADSPKKCDRNHRHEGSTQVKYLYSAWHGPAEPNHNPGLSFLFFPFFQRYPPRCMNHRGVLHSISYSAALSRYIYFYSGGNGSQGWGLGSGDDATWQWPPSLTSTTDF
jgi:hypothetical protein